MRKSEENSIFSNTPSFPILSSWILNLHIIMWQFKKKIHRDIFDESHCMFLPLVSANREKIIFFTSTLIDDGGLMIRMMITMKMMMMMFLFSKA